MRQQRPLAEYPGDVVTVACTRCARRGRYPKAALLRQHAPDLGCVFLLRTIAADCPKERNPDAWGNRHCGAYFVELDAEAKRLTAEMMRRG